VNAVEDYANLPEREQQLIDDLYRHWLITPAVVSTRHCPELSGEAVRKFLSRLVERDWLVRHQFGEHESYFVLGSRAINALGIRRETRALGHQSLLEHYAVLLACTRRGSSVLTEDEFRTQFPGLTEPGLSTKNFFIDESTTPFRLGLFVVDHDKLSTRLVEKVRNRIGRLMESSRPELRQAVLNGELSICVLTATAAKRANIIAAFARKPLRTVAVAVEAHDELDDFFPLKRR
jgi:hypothetical protein